MIQRLSGRRRCLVTAAAALAAAAGARAQADAPGEDALRAAYAGFVEQFRRRGAREYDVRHILVATRADADAALARIRAGERFADVAREVSRDPGSAAKGGDLGSAEPRIFVPEFARAMQALAPAGLSPEPVRTAFGWHVLEVRDVRDAEPPSFDEMRPALERRLRQAAPR